MCVCSSTAKSSKPGWPRARRCRTRCAGWPRKPASRPRPPKRSNIVSADRLLLVGKIVGLHGVDGWVKLESYTEPRLSIFRYQPWLVGDKEISGVQGREQGKGVIAKLPDCDDRDAAARLIGATIQVRRSAL